jgi:hypothetical protein
VSATPVAAIGGASNVELVHIRANAEPRVWLADPHVDTFAKANESRARVV